MVTVREERLQRKIDTTTDPAELEVLESKLAAERQRPARAPGWEPAVNRKKLGPLTLDRDTELALEWLEANMPTVEGEKPMELAELRRRAIQAFALELGWEPEE